jgi:YcxB-like protein
MMNVNADTNQEFHLLLNIKPIDVLKFLFQHFVMRNIPKKIALTLLCAIVVKFLPQLITQNIQFQLTSEDIAWFFVYGYIFFLLPFSLQTVYFLFRMEQIVQTTEIDFSEKAIRLADANQNVMIQNWSSLQKVSASDGYFMLKFVGRNFCFISRDSFGSKDSEATFVQL